MEITRLRYLALDIFKTLNKLNPYFMKKIFSKTTNFIIAFNQNNTTKCGRNSFQGLGPHICNSLPSEIKEDAGYEKIKNYINNWFSLKGKCTMCSFLNV